MCNHLPFGADKIEEEGFGFKLVRIRQGRIQPISYSGQEIQFDTIKNVWDSKYSWGYDSSSGFCFFLKQSECEKLKSLWEKTCTFIHTLDSFEIKKIKYTEGLGEAMVDTICNHEPFMVAYCRQFEFV